MFDLKEETEIWRTRLSKGSGLGTTELDELEDHLRASIQDRIRCGEPEEIAFRFSLSVLGEARSLATEFIKERSLMTPFSKITGCGISATLLLVTLVVWGGGLSMFIHMPSLLFVTGLVIGGLWACFGPRLLVDAARASVGGRPEIDPHRRALFLAVFRRGYQLAWASGVVGMITGIVQMLSELSDPARIGPGLAMSLLSVFYGALLAELGFRNLHQWIMNQVPVAVEAS